MFTIPMTSWVSSGRFHFKPVFTLLPLIATITEFKVIAIAPSVKVPIDRSAFSDDISLWLGLPLSLQQLSLYTMFYAWSDQCKYGLLATGIHKIYISNQSEKRYVFMEFNQ